MQENVSSPDRRSVDETEIIKFAALAEEWWNPDGKFRPLHRMNPARLAFVRDRTCTRFGRDPLAPRPLSGLRLVDVGCGGGLLSVPMARLGATVTGIDAGEAAIGAARHYAEHLGLDIDYRVATAEDLAAADESFDIVLNMEVVEHVADVEHFLDVTAKLVRPGGIMIAATLNRTLKSFALAIFGAEYVLRWLPPGTHEWRRFVRPSELAGALRRAGLSVEELVGLVYNPLKDRWQLAPNDLDVNYMAVATRSQTSGKPTSANV